MSDDVSETATGRWLLDVHRRAAEHEVLRLERRRLVDAFLIGADWLPLDDEAVAQVDEHMAAVVDAGPAPEHPCDLGPCVGCRFGPPDPG